ncbi:hypothetical protein T552_02816 [Pneumocystis carinii B80]|uniref:Protein dml1 n=1 Tax=Pneumocystis carinii (strain B80) TaxID=1408658 RepID=A0A0W4ZD49_PNEC8|nr:hypothetical protein T552_02816 [Pneumocystis carinii B80]KTW26331.1 hypothetical protein T552_02816 [Pneumocystis carinii B80]
MRENIVLQFGKYSNYLGTHFWNAQDTYFKENVDELLIDHHIFYRLNGTSRKKEIYTPRVLIYDLRNGFGNINKYNESYQLNSEDIEGRKNGLVTEIYESKKHPIHPFQFSFMDPKSEEILSSETITSWSDYNMVKYDSRSLHQLLQYDVYDESFNPFYTFDQGKELFCDISKENDIFESHFRPFLEECDNIQGITVLTEINSGWGGFSSSFLDSIKDEIPKLCIWTFSIDTEIDNDVQALLSLHDTSSILSIINKKSGYNHEKINLNSIWHTSAFQSSAIESLLIPCHSNVNFMSMSDLTSLINIYSDRKISYLKMKLENSLLGWLGLKLENSIESSLEIFRGDKNQKAISTVNNFSISTTYYHSTTLPSPKSFPKIFDSLKLSCEALSSSLDTKFLLSSKKKNYIHKNKSKTCDKEDIINDLDDLIEIYSNE